MSAQKCRSSEHTHTHTHTQNDRFTLRSRLRVARVITSTAATLQWLPPSPSERNGIIIGYNITIEDSLSGIEQDVLYSLRPILTINFLEPYTMYQYSIAAVTTVGQGPYSTFLLFQTNEAGNFLNELILIVCCL